METTVQFIQDKTRKMISLEDVTWAPNLGEQVRIDDGDSRISGTVIEISHEIYTKSKKSLHNNNG
jgi:hypothetical protein